jgi:hypothetical protein
MADHYDAEVNEGSINMTLFNRQLNSRWEQGWRLGRVFEQAGNTVIVWERRTGHKARERLGGRLRARAGQ